MLEVIRVNYSWSRSRSFKVKSFSKIFKMKETLKERWQVSPSKCRRFNEEKCHFYHFDFNWINFINEKVRWPFDTKNFSSSTIFNYRYDFLMWSLNFFLFVCLLSNSMEVELTCCWCLSHDITIALLVK